MAGKRKTILVVDDEESIRTLVKRTLRDRYTVLEASDGEEAVSAARSYHPDLVLMDIMMPRVDGYTACSQIRNDKATRTIPVIMLTAVDHALNVKLSTAVGANAYMTKPFSAPAMLSQIRQVIGE